MATTDKKQTDDARDHSLVADFSEGVTLESTELKPFDESLAREFLGLKTYDQERPIRHRHVNYLARAMERETFHLEHVQLMSCELDGEVYRGNGQHCCSARLHAEKCPGGTVAVYRYRAKTEKDLRQLYASIDRGAPRIKSHVVASYVGNEFNLDSRMSSLLSSSLVRMLKGNSGDRPLDGDELATLMLGPYNDVCRRVAGFLPDLVPQDSRHMKRAPVIAAVLATTLVDDEASEVFWRSVSTGLGFDRAADPRVRLREWLFETALAGNNRRMRQVSQEDMYRVSLNLWNAWRSGRDVHAVRIPHKRPTPI